MNQSPVKLYIDYLSQPCRAVIALCILENIPYEVIEVRLMKAQHRDPQYKKINEFQRVPAMDDNGFLLHESHAIMTYLHNKHGKIDSLYPKDLKKRAQIDSYLNWHHLNTRRLAVLYQTSVPKFFPNQKSTYPVELKVTAKVLKMIEDSWLNDSPYLCGNDQISIADISAVCETTQLVLMKFDFTPYPKIEKWIARCLKNPALSKAHEAFEKVKSKITVAPKL